MHRIPGDTRNSIYGPMGDGRGEDLSADQKEEIDGLRSNAIRRHLNSVTVVREFSFSDCFMYSCVI